MWKRILFFAAALLVLSQMGGHPAINLLWYMAFFGLLLVTFLSALTEG